jgi:hypothetical protein
VHVDVVLIQPQISFSISQRIMQMVIAKVCVEIALLSKRDGQHPEEKYNSSKHVILEILISMSMGQITLSLKNIKLA